jgi:hypothetical protein
MWPPANATSVAFPWNKFIEAREHLAASRPSQAAACWREVVSFPDLESRHYVQAWHFLRQIGVNPPPDQAKRILGVIGENGPSGVLVAAYEDRQARVYSDKGQGIAWLHPDTSLDSLIDSVLRESATLIRSTRTWHQTRPMVTVSNINIISFLTPSGLHLTLGVPGVMESAADVKPVADGLGLIIRALMQKTAKTS